MFLSKVSLSVFFVAMVIVSIGCSGGGNPVTAPDTDKPVAIDFSEGLLQDGRVLWGVWTLGIDPVEGRVDVIPNRDVSFHVNVKPFLMPPICNDCLLAQLTGVVAPKTYSINITLKNPTVQTGYDVRGTIFETGILKLKNPDSYSLFLAPPEDTSPNPFVAYDTPQPNRAFPGMSSHMETFHIYNFNHPDYSLVNYVVDASWPNNCKEPYEVRNPFATGTFKDDGSNTADIVCEVLDWQDNVEEVLVDLSSLGMDDQTPMVNTNDNIWKVEDASWQTGGMPQATYEGLITARTQGTQPKRETYNYVEIYITASGGPGVFTNEKANHLLVGEDAPTTCLDLAVIGDDDGASYTMVVGADMMYHLWDVLYEPAGGYVGLTTPFNNMLRFDNASLANPELPMTWAWVEVNDDPDIYDPGGDPPYDTPISWWVWIYWWDPVPSVKISGWIMFENPDDIMPPETYIESFDAFGGFNRDGLQYWASKYADGDPTLYPYIGVYGFVNPYNDPASFAFVGFAPEGSGDGFVDTDNVHSADIDDMEGYGEIYTVFAEGSPENAVEVFIYDFEEAVITEDFDMVSHTTIHPTNEPIDVEILPMKNLALDSNWICVLTSADEVEVYKISDGSLVTTFGDSENIAGEARYLDVDDLNYKVHIMQDGPQISVFYYDP